MYFETRAVEYFVLYAIIFHHFSIMEPCHSCMHCWKKSDLVRQAVAAICYHYCDSLKNIYGCSFNLWFVNVLHFQSWKKKVQTIHFSSLKCKSAHPDFAKGPRVSIREQQLIWDAAAGVLTKQRSTSLGFSDLCTSFLCVRVRFRIQPFSFSYCTQ